MKKLQPMKKMFDISWQVDEPTYRNDPALSQSSIAKFARDGFQCLGTLFDKIETPSLTYGTAVDALLTGGEDEFNEKFFVAGMPALNEKMAAIVNELFALYGYTYQNLVDIPRENILAVANKMQYQQNWKPETRVKVILEQADNYYDTLYIAQGKKIVDCEFAESARNAARAMKEGETIKKYFNNGPFSDYVNEYQLKFKRTIDNVPYRGMCDCIHINPTAKTVEIVDLKTSGHPEYDFPKSFLYWRYDIQARLYWRMVYFTMKEDAYWSGYSLMPWFTFVVVNKETLTPLAWRFNDANKVGTLQYGDVTLDDPCDIGAKLHKYLNIPSIKVPDSVKIDEPNDIIKAIVNKKTIL